VYRRGRVLNCRSVPPWAPFLMQSDIQRAGAAHGEFVGHISTNGADFGRRFGLLRSTFYSGSCQKSECVCRVSKIDSDSLRGDGDLYRPIDHRGHHGSLQIYRTSFPIRYCRDLDLVPELKHRLFPAQLEESKPPKLTLQIFSRGFPPLFLNIRIQPLCQKSPSGKFSTVVQHTLVIRYFIGANSISNGRIPHGPGRAW
jgi:hypothetical protein